MPLSLVMGEPAYLPIVGFFKEKYNNVSNSVL